MIDWDQVNSLRKNENMTYIDISTLLGISYGTIRNHYWKNKIARVDRRGYTNWNKHAHLLGVVSDKEIAGLTAFLKNQGVSPQYTEEVTEMQKP